MDLWQESLLAFLEKCRQVLEAGGTRMGLMSSSMESHGAEGRRWEAWWQTFGGGQPPIHRPHFWTYSDAGSLMLIHGIAALDQNRSIQPPGLETGPEIENFPYGPWNKSFRQTFAQMAVAQIGGSTHLNISMYDFMGNRPDDEPQRATFLKRSRPALDWLAEQFPMEMRSVGVGVPWSQDQGRAVHTSCGDSWFELQPASRGWVYWLGAAGLAFSARPQTAGVNALAGGAAWSFSEEDLQSWLSSGLLLDGEAASILVQRGMGKWIGIKEIHPVSQEEVLYAIEACRDPRFALRPGAQISVNSKAHTRRIFQALAEDGTQAISELLNPLQHPVGHGALIYENELGGRAAVVPWSASAAPIMDIHRAAQLRRLVGWLANEQSTGSVRNGASEGGASESDIFQSDAWLVSQFFNAGSLWRGVVWNAGFDEAYALRVQRPNGMPPIRQAWQLSWNGERHPVEVDGDGDGDLIRLERPLYQWDLLVITS